MEFRYEKSNAIIIEIYPAYTLQNKTHHLPSRAHKHATLIISKIRHINVVSMLRNSHPVLPSVNSFPNYENKILRLYNLTKHKAGFRYSDPYKKFNKESSL